MLKNHWKESTVKHTWEKYIANCLEGHQIFEDVNEPISESMKIDFFKCGIRSEANLESELAVARGRSDASVSFDSYVYQLTKGVSNRRSREATFRNLPREVSSYHATGRGRGRGGGKERYSNRLHRGRGCGRDYGKGSSRGRYLGRLRVTRHAGISNSITVDGTTLYPYKTYTQEEYNQLSYHQKDKLRSARVGRMRESVGLRMIFDLDIRVVLKLQL